MDLVSQYLARATEIIGERTPSEEKHDSEVVRWLEKGKPIRKALAKANENFPTEALAVADEHIPDLQARYEYLLEHERILRRLKR